MSEDMRLTIEAVLAVATAVCLVLKMRATRCAKAHKETAETSDQTLRLVVRSMEAALEKLNPEEAARQKRAIREAAEAESLETTLSIVVKEETRDVAEAAAIALAAFHARKRTSP